MESTVKKDKKINTTLMILAAVILVLVLVVALILIPKEKLAKVKNIFVSKDEYTLNLEEFILNLQSENSTKAYLKVEVGLMYTNKKDIKLVETSVSKIRDIVLNNFRGKTASEMNSVIETDKLKEKIRVDINEVLKKDVIKEVYYTNLIVQ